MGRYLELAQRVLERLEQEVLEEGKHTATGGASADGVDAFRVPDHPAEALGQSRQSQEVLTLRPRLAELRQRIDAGFEVLRAREEANNTAHPFPLWLATWEKLLREYEDAADKLASLTHCPIGDCARMGECNADPTACPAVGVGSANG